MNSPSGTPCSSFSWKRSHPAKTRINGTYPPGASARRVWREGIKEGNLGDEPGFAELRPDAETMLELILAWIFFL
jgi:hypothetical protein